MANPTLTPFPTPPLPEQDEVTFNRNAANSLLAQANFVGEANTVVTWMGQQVTDVASYKKAAADSATAAGQAVTDAQTQVKLATDQAVASKGSADAAARQLASTETVAAAVRAQINLPSLAGQKGKYWRVADDEKTLELVPLVISQVGDTLVSTQAPDNTWVPTGRVYSQATYPALFAKLGVVADWAPSQQLVGNVPNSFTYPDMVFGNGLFVALDTNSGTALTSPDGVTWTVRALPVSANFAAVEYGTNFVAVATSTSSTALTSPDGITWTARTLPSTESWTNVKYSNGVYLAVAGGRIAASSTNGGASWTLRNTPANNVGGLYGLAASPTTFLTLTGGQAYYTSSNGVDWTNRTMPIIAGAVIYANNVFFALNSVGQCAVSSDGVNWQSYTMPASASSFVVAGGGGQFIMKIVGSTTYYTSTVGDPGKWTARVAGFADPTGSKMVYGNRSFVSIDTNGNTNRRIRRPWSYDSSQQFFTTDPIAQSQGLSQYIKAA